MRRVVLPLINRGVPSFPIEINRQPMIHWVIFFPAYNIGWYCFPSHYDPQQSPCEVSFSSTCSVDPWNCLPLCSVWEEQRELQATQKKNSTPASSPDIFPFYPRCPPASPTQQESKFPRHPLPLKHFKFWLDFQSSQTPLAHQALLPDDWTQGQEGGKNQIRYTLFPSSLAPCKLWISKKSNMALRPPQLCKFLSHGNNGSSILDAFYKLARLRYLGSEIVALWYTTLPD